MRNAVPKKDWSLTQKALLHLLDWLDEGTDSSGQKYLEMRRRLVAYFDRKNCLSPDELTDETLNRVARRLEEEGSIETDTPAHYCYIVARFVFMEHLRAAERFPLPLDELQKSAVTNSSASIETNDEINEREKLLACLERCTQDLEPESRDLIMQYYYGEQRVKIENRRTMAARLGLTVNALSIRACRIRARLESCVSRCAKAK